MLRSDESRGVIDRLHEQNAALAAEVEALRERLSELEQLADTDTLVPLPNRRALTRELDRVIASVSRYGHRAAVLFVDLNGLKAINDQHGHQAGDAVLLHVARLLTSSLRASDMVARVGGDEFCLVLDHLDEAAARAKVAALVATIAQNPADLGRVTLPVSVTAGLAMVRDGDRAEDVLARADRAMYAQRSER